jgi:hypothetical protein
MTQLHIAVRDGRKAIIPTTKPVVFSAGPIRNAPVWQNDAMRIAVARDEDIFFASPLRDGEDGFAADLIPYFAPFVGEANFPRQRAWEQYYLNQAGMYQKEAKNTGCVFFYLEEPLLRAEWKWPEKSYAQITMYEMGQWVRTKHLIPETRLVIGANANFPELSTLVFDIKEELGADFLVYGSLEATVNAAIDVAIS